MNEMEVCEHGYAVLWSESCPANHWDGAPQIAHHLVLLSQWINAGNTHRDPESVLWSRVLKVSEEAGEVYAALSGAIGENPRKGVTHTMTDVVDELLDVASAALCAVEHVTGHQGRATNLLAARVRRTVARAGIDPVPSSLGAATGAIAAPERSE